MYDYKDYWDNGKRDGYYENIYSRVLEYFHKRDNIDKEIVDFGGGSGEFLSYFKIRKALVLDVSTSGLVKAEKRGYSIKKINFEEKIDVASNLADIGFCCEVLEHLRYPNLLLFEASRIIKTGDSFFVSVPNMKPDGVQHVRRYYYNELVQDLDKFGFTIKKRWFMQAFRSKNTLNFKSPFLFFKSILLFSLSMIPSAIMAKMSNICPNRFASFYILEAIRR